MPKPGRRYRLKFSNRKANKGRKPNFGRRPGKNNK